MIRRVLAGLIAVMFGAPFTPYTSAQPDEYKPDPGTVQMTELS